jgi:hypothetical protein
MVHVATARKESATSHEKCSTTFHGSVTSASTCSWATLGDFGAIPAYDAKTP